MTKMNSSIMRGVLQGLREGIADKITVISEVQKQDYLMRIDNVAAFLSAEGKLEPSETVIPRFREFIKSRRNGQSQS